MGESTVVSACQAIREQTGRERQAQISLHNRRERCREVVRDLSAFNSRFLAACEGGKLTHKETIGYRDEGVQVIRRAAETLRQEDFQECWPHVEENAQHFLSSDVMRDKAKSLPLRGAIQIAGDAIKEKDIADAVLQVCQEPMLCEAMAWVVTLYEETAGLGRHGWHRSLLPCGDGMGAPAGHQQPTPATSQAAPDPGPFPDLLDPVHAKDAMRWVVADISLKTGPYNPSALVEVLVEGMSKRGVPRGDAVKLLDWLIKGQLGISKRGHVDHKNVVVAGHAPNGRPYLDYRHYITLDVNIEALLRALADLSPPTPPAVQATVAPLGPPLARAESVFSASGEEAEDEDGAPCPGKIPPERRTIPLSITQAACLMGYTGSKQARARRLRQLIKDGSIACERLTRQSYVFDRNDFPCENRDRVIPTHPTSR